MTAPPLTLPGVLQRLRDSSGPPLPPPTADPFELVLFENVSYLAPPDRRRAAFLELKAMVGTRPEDLLKASAQALEAVTARGILKGTSAAKLRDCARIAVEAFQGDLATALAGAVEVGKKALRAFPGIGEPGAEKILLFAGLHPYLAPESNGLRVLVRLGLIAEGRSYGATYAAGRAAAAELPAEIGALQEAHLLLQRHGQTLCRRGVPRCAACPLRGVCAHARDA